jgi:hypothetical protein
MILLSATSVLYSWRGQRGGVCNAEARLLARCTSKSSGLAERIAVRRARACAISTAQEGDEALAKAKITHTHTHTHTHTRTNKHTRTHTHKHTGTDTLLHKHIPPTTPPYTRT